MGFDIYGSNPDLKYERPTIDWDSKPTDEEKDKYFKATDQFEQDHPGYYFRNNVWYWRPLWHYICEAVAPKILSEDDKNGGAYNDGYKINAVKAIYIADKIQQLDESGELDSYAEQFEKARKSLPKTTCEHCRGKGERNDKHVKGKCNACDGSGKASHMASHYPFDADNVREFGKFCRASGGFEVR
tara:strand:+ start:1292 stop:1849 length:558 start_codon:yes stop_codon:yes gene_type:complete